MDNKKIEDLIFLHQLTQSLPTYFLNSRFNFDNFQEENGHFLLRFATEELTYSKSFDFLVFSKYTLSDKRISLDSTYPANLWNNERKQPIIENFCKKYNINRTVRVRYDSTLYDKAGHHISPEQYLQKFSYPEHTFKNTLMYYFNNTLEDCARIRRSFHTEYINGLFDATKDFYLRVKENEKLNKILSTILCDPSHYNRYTISFSRISWEAQLEKGYSLTFESLGLKNLSCIGECIGLCFALAEHLGHVKAPVSPNDKKLLNIDVVGNVLTNDYKEVIFCVEGAPTPKKVAELSNW